MLNNDILLVIALKCHNIRQFSNMNEIIYCKDKMQKWMIEKIHKRLERKGLNATEFVEKMIESKGVMSGSFLLQCVHDEEYDGSDIDVFILDDTRECINGFVPFHTVMADSQSEADIIEFQETLYKNGNYLKRSQMRNTNIYKNLYITDAFEKHVSTFANFGDAHAHYIDGTYKALDYSFNDSIIQIIYIKKDRSLPEYINNFDFDVCKITYDGYTVYHENWKSIINKEIVVNNDGVIKSIGLFSGNSLLKPDDTILQLKDKLDMRIAKYKARGFTFIGDANSDMFDEYLQ